MVAGHDTPDAGTITLDGHDVTKADPAAHFDRGLAYVPEDRQRDGLVPTMSVGENLTLASLGRYVRGGRVSAQREREAIDRIVRDVTVKASGPDAPIGSLSGGNQQKVVLGKALLTDPRVLVLDEPTRGIDVGAKAEIFALMTEQAKRGLGVLFATSELEEALHVPDRLLVMWKGRIVREIRRGTATREEIMAASEGLAKGETAGGAS
jgi:erythritol transport system ATP-binding protein